MNWTAGSFEVDEPDIDKAWSEFLGGSYQTAQAYIGGSLAEVGSDWGPSSGADAQRSWNWMRLVCELAALDRGAVVDTRRSWVSAAELASKCLPEADELIAELLSNALDDFAAGDLTSERAWCAYTARGIAAAGHEMALSTYSNAEKAKLRDAWTAHFGLSSDDARSTVSMATAVTPRLRRVTQGLYVSARDGSNSAKALKDASREIALFLDVYENELFASCMEAALEVFRTVSAENTNRHELEVSIEGLRALGAAISSSGSGILQDFIAPHLAVLEGVIEAAIARLGDISRPDLAVRLASSTIPFSSAVGSTYEVRLILTNSGNATAEDVRVVLRQVDLGIEGPAHVDAIGPGAETDVVIQFESSGEAPAAVILTCDLSWSDSLLQHFEASEKLSAEDQKSVSWSTNDVNPFSLGTISEPSRLVGRAEDLNSLDALIAGGASAYITGHKRVGKTSLTKVLLNSISDSRGWAGSLLPLGRALGQDQSASDIVYALLDEILSAARDAYDGHVQEVEEVSVDESGNFARSANRWVKKIARALPKNARVVVAIDDFDELPNHLVKGPQADALFLFLRSLVDEPWLNIIVVGSEILPTIIQAQAHKLNQVVPVSVTNFSSRRATAELLVSPTADRLEWSGDSIDRVHYLCGGNPYYETLLAQRLWQMMRDRERSFVSAADVDEAAIAVASEASDSHFVHLWADSSTGLDHTSRAAVVSSAVVRSVARCGGEKLAPAEGDEVVRIAGNWIQSATSDEFKKSIALLRSRQVLEAGPSSESLLLKIPLVGIWLNSGGARALDTLYASSKHATATTRMVTDSDLVELSRNLMYHGEHVTEIRIRAWLAQFGDHYHEFLAFRVLRRMVLDGYYTSTKLQSTVLPRLAVNVNRLAAARHFILEKNNQSLKNAFLIDHGVAGDSTQGTLSTLAKALKIKKANVVATSLVEARIRQAKSSVVLFLLDDFSGSGTHLSRVLQELLEIVERMGDGWSEQVNIVLGAGVVADLSALAARSDSPIVERVCGVELGDRFWAFRDSSGIFESDSQRVDAEEMFRSIGGALLPSNPLGFGGGALLALFEFNCPNNAPPVFWKRGTVSGQPWSPLFERST